MWTTSKFLQVLAGLLDIVEVLKVRQAELQARDISLIARETHMALLIEARGFL